jgi:hypothetical protein
METSPELAPANLELPLLAYQEGRLLMDSRARRRALPWVRTIPLAYRIEGALDLPSLGRALRELVRRHEALRTFFPGGRRQLVAESATLAVPVRDVASEPERDRVVRELLAATASKPFDPTTPPRMAASVLRLGPQDHVLLLSFDHLVVDGWARRILVRELGELYGSFSTSREPALPEPSYRYRDYVRERHELESGEGRERVLAWWRERLADIGPVPAVAFPAGALADGVGPAGGAERATLPPELANALRAVSRRQRATPLVTMLAVVAVTLARSTGSWTQAVAVHASTRSTVEAEALVAPLADILMIRIDFEPSFTLRDAVSRTRSAVLETHEHAGIPYGEIVKALAPPVYGDPEFPIGVLFNMLARNVPGDVLELPGLRCAPVELDESSVRPRCVLGLTASLASDSLELLAHYQADRLRHCFVAELLRSVGSVLRATAVEPDRRLDEVALAGSA